MFATLLGALPRPPIEADAPIGTLVEAAVRAQEAAGLEPITDGGFGPADDPLAAWRATARLTDRAVKQALEGPYSHGHGGTGPAAARAAVTLDRATALNALLRELAAAGCPLIEIHEPAVVSVGTDPAERALFRDAHLRLLDGVPGVHLSLALTGGNADAAGIETLLAAPYASLAVDLIAGPDNWRLVTATPGDLGIVCGALSVTPDSYDGPEPLVWAAGYAASTWSRGPARVGLATAGSLRALPWAIATAKMTRLGEAARLATAPASERVEAMDPRAVSSRAAALGRSVLPPGRDPHPGDDPT
jgi:methionine synthase II (cobalamin-independent)